MRDDRWSLHSRAWPLAIGVALGLACTPDEPTTADDDPVEEPPDVGWPLPRTCEAPAGLGRPRTIEELVALVDALPKPTSLPCVLESLDRPLSIYATTSTAGAQPASGPENPRVFVLEGDLAMSVILEGEHAATLELAYAIGNRLSIKAELAFPIAEALTPSAPYDQVLLGTGTNCGLCHGHETRVSTIEFATAYASDVFQDEPDQALSLAFLRQSAIDCDHASEPERCEMLDALFGHGDVVAGDLARDALVCHPF